MRASLLAAGVVVSALAVKGISGWSFQMNAEYITAGVIREVTKFAETHQGEWPRTWDDIPGDTRAPRYVHVDFDVDLEQLIDDPERIQRAIQPVTGVYRTYPHARRHLEELREIIVAHRTDLRAERGLDTGMIDHRGFEPEADPSVTAPPKVDLSAPGTPSDHSAPTGRN
jgi:hypothetical protein